MKKIKLEETDELTLKEAVTEARVLASLDCAYIVKYFDSFIEDSALYIILELCDKGDLKTYLDRRMGRPLDEKVVRKFFVQLCLGLEYLHYHHILHRDIKSRNVFLVNEDTLRIGDLGLAKVLALQNDYAHTIVGTPYYLSPELLQGQPYNQKSDVWALGCVLYELMMLRSPFEAATEGELALRICRGTYTPLGPQYSYEIKDIVRLCLTTNVARRPSITDLLKLPELQEWAQDSDVEVPRRSVLSRRLAASVPLRQKPRRSEARPLPQLSRFVAKRRSVDGDTRAPRVHLPPLARRGSQLRACA